MDHVRCSGACGVMIHDQQPVLAATALAKMYAGRRILTAADLQITRGRVTALLGRMGTGKSTVLHICAGLVRPDSGTITISGETVPRPTYSAMARLGVYYLAADGAGVPRFTLRRHLAELRRRYGAYDVTAVVHALTLEPLFDTPFRSLSGGERKRAEIALAVARQPRILLADELFRDLDPITAERVGTILRDLARTGCAIVVTGHEAGTILFCADEVLWLTAGRIHPLGAPADADRHERFVEEYLRGDVRGNPDPRQHGAGGL